MSTLKRKNSFTLTEIMIVIILIGVIAAFAIPNYRKSLEQSYEKEAVRILTMLHAAEQMKRAQESNYWPDINITVSDASNINSNLNINIIEEGFGFSCTGTDGTTFSATAARNGGSYTLRVNQTPLGASNPCCSAGTCPTKPSC